MGPRRPVRCVLLRELGNRGEAASKPGPGRSWCRHGNRAAAAPPGAWPFPSAFLAGFLSHLETHSPKRTGASPLTPTPSPPFGSPRPGLPPPPLPPPPLPLPASLCQSAGRRELGQGRTQIFNSKQISPPQAASPFMHFFFSPIVLNAETCIRMNEQKLLSLSEPWQNARHRMT